jgi:hypothetical protein
MRSMAIGLGLVAGLVLGGAAASAQDASLVESVANGCKKELESHCSEVTPGEGRMLACLYAHNDKLSGSCEYALYDAAVQLERYVAALTYVANECDEDIDTHCASVEMGEGRVAQCLMAADVSARCATAMKDVGMKK